VKSGVKTVMGGVAAAVAASLALIAWLRIEEARQFSQPRRVATDGGTNYVIQLIETDVGKSDSGYVLIVYARLENPNPYDVVLRRDWFALADQAKDHLLPTTNGAQTTLIRLPASSVLEREMFSFDLPPSTLAGIVEMKIGENFWVTIKNEKQFTRALRTGEFVSFRSRDW
jgi:hypothetical protein